jgi:hypothetical protein
MTKKAQHLILNQADAKQVEQVPVHAVHAHAAATKHDNELLAVAPSHGDYAALGPLDGAQQLSGRREDLEDGVRGFSSQAHDLAFVANDGDRAPEACTGNHHFRQVNVFPLHVVAFDAAIVPVAQRETCELRADIDDALAHLSYSLFHAPEPESNDVILDCERR